MILDYTFCNFTHLIFRQSYKKIKILRDVYKNNGDIFYKRKRHTNLSIKQFLSCKFSKQKYYLHLTTSIKKAQWSKTNRTF